MPALRLLVRRSLRVNARAILGLALVVALTGAVALTALAGARRTASAFGRYQAASHASDVALNIVSSEEADSEDTGSTSPGAVLAIAARARRLPEVVAVASYIGLESVALVDDEGVLLDVQPEVIGSLDGRFIDQDRVAISEGRVPDPAAADEVFVNRRLARSGGFRVGSTVHLAVYPLSAVDGRRPVASWSPSPAPTPSSSASASSPTRSSATTSTAAAGCSPPPPSPSATAGWPGRTSGPASGSPPAPRSTRPSPRTSPCSGPISRSTSSAATCSATGSSVPSVRSSWHSPRSASPRRSPPSHSEPSAPCASSAPAVTGEPSAPSG